MRSIDMYIERDRYTYIFIYIHIYVNHANKSSARSSIIIKSAKKSRGQKSLTTTALGKVFLGHRHHAYFPLYIVFPFTSAKIIKLPLT